MAQCGAQGHYQPLVYKQHGPVCYSAYYREFPTMTMFNLFMKEMVMVCSMILVIWNVCKLLPVITHIKAMINSHSFIHVSFRPTWKV